MLHTETRQMTTEEREMVGAWERARQTHDRRHGLYFAMHLATFGLCGLIGGGGIGALAGLGARPHLGAYATWGALLGLVLILIPLVVVEAIVLREGNRFRRALAGDVVEVLQLAATAVRRLEGCHYWGVANLARPAAYLLQDTTGQTCYVEVPVAPGEPCAGLEIVRLPGGAVLRAAWHGQPLAITGTLPGEGVRRPTGPVGPITLG